MVEVAECAFYVMEQSLGSQRYESGWNSNTLQVFSVATRCR